MYFSGPISQNNPKIHSFRVVTARDATVNISEPNKISKPILMCFICKLSFGNTKSFSLHANSEHTLNLHESEKLLLNREYSSAILQRNVDEKPQISFLEPLDIMKNKNHDFSMNPITTTAPSTTTTTPTPIGIELNCSNSNNNSAKLLSDFIHQQQQRNDLLQQQLHQQQQTHNQLTCSDHQGMKGIDCKSCEMMSINLKLPMTPTKSPNSIILTPPSNLNMSPTSAAPSFTIGACPEHINGRPIGVDCAR